MRKRHVSRNSEPAVHSSKPDLNQELGWMVLEALCYAGTERGRLAFERLWKILAKPAYRIARAELEAILPRNQVGVEEIKSVVRMSMVRLYNQLDQYEPGSPAIPWFASLVRSCAEELVRGSDGDPD